LPISNIISWYSFRLYLQAIAKAQLNRSLEEFEKALVDHESELGSDVIIQSHVADMNDSMLANNLSRIVEPYSSIEIEHVVRAFL
jgi:26S proteasome regulatory subunit N6